jgi:hypothetical protein
MWTSGIDVTWERRGVHYAKNVNDWEGGLMQTGVARDFQEIAEMLYLRRFLKQGIRDSNDG